MNGTVSVRARLSALAEDGVAWLIESGALGGFLALAILAAILGGRR